MSQQQVEALKSRISEQIPALSPEVVALLGEYYALVLDENERQNLTRLTEPRDFFDGMVLDSWELLKSDLVSFPALDLGSGSGVPGLVCAIMRPDVWVLCDSEGHKAEFLRRAVELLGLSARVSVVSGRAEAYLGKNNQIKSVVAKAVGPVERIYGWLAACSTWNNLVLLKGPKWEEEWSAFKAGRFRSELSISGSHEYSLSDSAGEIRRRRIFRLERVLNPHVPRGT